MRPEDEVQRLERVYAHYDSTPGEQAKRDPANVGNVLIGLERRRVLGRMLLRRHGQGLGSLAILDVGCGRGEWLAWLEQLGASPSNLHGIDLLSDRIAAARRAHPLLTFMQADASEFDAASGSYDLIVCSMVFSSVQDRHMTARIAQNVQRLLTKDGEVLWYDMRYPNPGNSNIHRMTRASIASLFPGFGLELRSMTLLPPLARRLGFSARVLYPALATVPPLRTHLGGILSRRGSE